MADSDDEPKRAKGKKQWRVNRAIHLDLTTQMTKAEIGDELGVSERTARRYCKSPPAQEVQETLQEQATRVRMAAFSELRRQLRAAGERSRSAEKPVKVWRDDADELAVRDVEDDEGNLLKKVPVPADLVMGPDEEARFYARKEARDILEQLVDLVGAGEPERVELSGDVEHGASEELEELLDEAGDLF